MRKTTAYLAGAGLLLLTFGVAYSTPGSDVVEGPMAVRAVIGEQATAGDLVGTVNDVALAEVVELDSTRLTTAGVWFVADLTVAATTERTLVRADVLIDGVRYPASSRASDTIDSGVVDAGFPYSGPLIVELPADVQDLPGAATAVLRISPRLDSRLDGVLEVVVDLTRLEVEDLRELSGLRAGER